MAKGARSSTKKENNRRKYASVFSPVEAARNERLSAKLLELARQPKHDSTDTNMDGAWPHSTLNLMFSKSDIIVVQ